MSELKNVPLAFKHRQRLQKMGYFQLQDILQVSVDELAHDLQLIADDLDEARLLQQQCLQFLDRQEVGMFQLLADMQSEHLATGFMPLDDVLGGGLPFGKCIELYGESGVGCTQLCMQTCANLVVMSNDSKCLYVDTEGTFMAERMAQMILCRLMETMEGQTQDSIDKDWLAMKVEQCMSRIIVIQIVDDLEFMRVLEEMEDTVLKQHAPAMKLIVIDSIAQPFRFSFDTNWSERTFLLSYISQRLMSIASEYNLVLLQTNQVTTKFQRPKQSDTENGKSDLNEVEGYLAPCLGESWTYAATVRCFISRTNYDRAIRTCRIVKFPYQLDQRVFKFTITVFLL